MGESVQDTQTMYREEEKLCLKWNDFQENAISAFGTLREDREFADVTLACEDGQQVEAHKVILASSSPFFLNLLRRNNHPHPLIYMRGLKSEDLLAMIDFLYHGEANVYQENLDSFLAVAEELQLKGLMGSSAEKETEEVNEKPQSIKKSQPKKQAKGLPLQEMLASDLHGIVNKVETEPQIDGTVAVTDFTVAADLQDLNEQIESMIEVSEHKDKFNNGKARVCKVCGKEGKLLDIKRHIEANHITGISHTCNICGKTSRSANGLRQHMTMNHKN